EDVAKLVLRYVTAQMRSKPQVRDRDRFAVEVDGEVLQQHDAAAVEQLAPDVGQHSRQSPQREMPAVDAGERNAAAPHRLYAGNQLADFAAVELIAPGCDVAQVFAAARGIDDG